MRILTVAAIMLFAVCGAKAQGICQNPVTDNSGRTEVTTTLMSDTLVVCGDKAQFRVIVENNRTSALTDVVLLPKMPAGIYALSSPAPQGMTLLSGDSLMFSVGTIAANTTDTLTFWVKADCGLIDYLEQEYPGQSGGIVNNETRLYYEANDTCFRYNEPYGSESYNVAYADFEVFVINNTKTLDAYTYKIVTRDIKVRNSGVGYNTRFVLKVDYEEGQELRNMVFDGTALTPSAHSGNHYEYIFTAADFANIGDQDTLFDENEEVILHDTVKVLECDPSLRTDFTARWGCPDTVTCNEGDQEAEDAAYINVNEGIPNMSVTMPSFAGIPWCADTAHQVTFVFKNIGSENAQPIKDRATDVFIKLLNQSAVSSCDNYRILTATGWDTLPVTIVGNYAYIDTSIFVSDIDGAGRGFTNLDNDTLYDDLAVGDSIVIRYDVIVNHEADIFNECTASGFIYGAYADVNVENPCGESRSALNGAAVDRTTYAAGSAGGPVDLADSQTAWYTFSYNVSLTNSLNSCNTSEYFVIGRLPGEFRVNLVTYSNDTLEYSQTGDTLMITGGGQGTYNVRITLDCNYSSGASLYDTIKWEAFFTCDTTCNRPIRLACASHEVFNHCYVCSGFHTTSFTVERRTFGWFLNDRSIYTVHDWKEAVKVTEDTAGINLKAAYETDTILAVASGMFNGSSSNNAYVDIQYTLPGDSNWLEFASGYFMINSVQTSIESYSVSGSNGTWHWKFKAADTTIVLNDDIDLYVYFKVKKLPYVSAGIYTLGRFRAAHFGVDSNDDTVSCESFGDQFSIMRNYAYTYPNNYYNNNCTAISTMTMWIANQSDIFPREFRPVSYYDTIWFILPDGYRYVDSSASFYYSTDLRVYLDAPVQSGDTLIWAINENTWRVQEASASWLTTFNLYIEPDCDSIISDNIMNAVSFNEQFSAVSYAYAAPPERDNNNGSMNPNLYPLRYNYIEAYPDEIQEGYKSTVTWPVVLRNQTGYTGYAHNNVWVAVEPHNPNTHLRNAKILKDGAWTLLTTIPYGPGNQNMLIQVGDMGGADVKNINITAGYTNCEDDVMDTLDLFWSRGCEYPDTSGIQSILDADICRYPVHRDTLWLRYKTANLQWTIDRLNPGTLDLCDSAEYEVTFTSSKYANMDVVKFWMDMDTGVVLDTNNISYIYPYPSGTSTPLELYGSSAKLDGDTIGWAINEIVGADDDDLPGSRLASTGENVFKLRFNLMPQCGFDAGKPVIFHAYGITNCSDTINLEAQYKLRLTDLPLDTIDVQIHKSPFAGCFGQNTVHDTITVRAINNGTQTSREETLWLTLPAGIAYSSGANPAPDNVNGNVLRWNIGTMPVGDTFMVRVPTYIADTAVNNDTIYYYARTSIEGDAECILDEEMCHLIGTTGSADTTVIVNLHAPAVTLAQPDTVCAYSNAQVQLTAQVTHAVSPYNYSWACAGTNCAIIGSGATVLGRVNVPTLFTVTVTDAGGCTGSAGVTAQVYALPNITNVGSQGVSCSGRADGMVWFTISGGTSPYDYRVIPSSFRDTSDVPITDTVYGLAQGSPMIWVTDQHNCQAGFTQAVPYRGPDIVMCASTVSCSVPNSTDVTTTVYATATHGLRPGQPYQYKLTDTRSGAYVTGSSTFGTTLSPINMTVQVGDQLQFEVLDADSNDCYYTEYTTVTRANLTITLGNQLRQRCTNIVQARFDLGITSCTDINDTVDYELSWFDELTMTYKHSSYGKASAGEWFEIEGLGPALYRIDATHTRSGFSCTAQQEFTLLSSVMDDTVYVKPVSCHGGADGAANVAVTGNVGDMEYAWYDGDWELISNLSSVFALTPGTYHVVFEDHIMTESGETVCADTSEAVITEPAPLPDPGIDYSIGNCYATATIDDPGVTVTSFTWVQVVNGQDVARWTDPVPVLASGSYTSNTGTSTSWKLTSGTWKVIVQAGTCTVESDTEHVELPVREATYLFCFRWTTTPEIECECPETDCVCDTIECPCPDMPGCDCGTGDPPEPPEPPCVKREVEAFKDAFESYCYTPDSINDEVTIDYCERLYHFTLYYYDRGGRLERTVPPKGVHLVNSRAQHPPHTFETTYNYNSLAQLTWQNTPDGGSTSMIYNNMGQLRFSQNAQQAADTVFSYTKYDALGRIREAGKAGFDGSPLGIASFSALQASNVTDLDTNLYKGTLAYEAQYPYASQGLSEQTKTVYSDEADWIGYKGTAQRYLLNRVSYSYTNDINGERAATYYSYDPHGNLEWLVQEVPGIGRNYVKYEYDLVSGKVLKVRFNENIPGTFFHRYSYDEDNRITLTETSPDEQVWDRDAGYSYYKHGPLRTTKVGEDKIQKVDYTYTIHGWLKGINTPGLAVSDTTFAGPEFGMALGYYAGDFTRAGSPFYSNSANPYYLTNGRHLYNGNISSWVQGISDITSGKLTTGEVYTYDKLNRITSSAYNTFNDTIFSATSDYATSYSYDPNGNILSLTRNGYAASGNLPMDNLTYHYQSPETNNKLDYVDDNVTAGNYGTDIDGGQSTGNYLYDSTGNMIRDEQEGITITWNLYGKVAEVIPDENGSAQKPHIKFTYDATGNRVRKQVNTKPYYAGAVFRDTITDPTAITSTLYIRDASGNIMAVYERTNSLNQDSTQYIAEFRQIEAPIYGSSRVGEYMSDSVVAEREFTVEHFNDVSLEFDPLNRITEYVNWTAPVNTMDSLMVNDTMRYITNTKLYHVQYNTTANAYQKIQQLTGFMGELGRNVAVAEDTSGNVLFYAAVAKNYWGEENFCMVLDTAGTIMTGSEEILADAGSRIHAVNVKGTWMLVTVDTDGSLYYHVVDPVAKEVTDYNINLEGSINEKFTGSMTAVEDNVNGRVVLYASRAEDDSLELMYYDLTKTLPQSGLFMAKLAIDSATWDELQVSPDGRSLMVYYGSRRDQGWFDHKEASVAVFDIGNAYKIVDNDEFAEIKTVTLPTGTEPNMSADFSKDNNKVYYAQHGLAELQTGANEFVYTYDMNSGTLLHTAATNEGDVRRGKDSLLYIAGTDALQLATLKENLDGTITSGTAVGIDTVISGGLALQAHKVYTTTIDEAFYNRFVGYKKYELTDHLGNVRVVVSDVKTPKNVSDTTEGYNADVQTYSSYFAFGMQLPGRNFNNTGYRFGFNGQEKTPELGEGHTTALYWEYDGRLGRRWNLDPKPLPFYSAYACFRNNPVWYNDILGDTSALFNSKTGAFIRSVDNGKKDWSGSLVSVNEKTGNLVYEKNFTFNDPENDVKDIKEKKITHVSVMSNEQMTELLVTSGVLKVTPENATDYAWTESPGGRKMDYSQYLSSNTLYIPEKSSTAYNQFDAGNFLWGMGMKQLGFSEFKSQWGAEYAAWKWGKKWYPGDYKGGFNENATLDQAQWWKQKTWTGDASGDQRAIEMGWRYYPKLKK